MTHPSEDIIDFYKRNAQTFDRQRSRAGFERGWLDKFSRMAVNNGHILDLGCGMAEPIAAHFIASGYQITGIDSSDAFIDLCRVRFPDQTWNIGDMREINLGKKFDGIIAWDSFFHLNENDQICMFPKFAEHAKTGAPLMFTAGPEHGEATNPLWDAPLFHYSLSLDEYRDLLDQNGFRLIDYKHNDPDCGRRSIYLAQKN